ncbi:serine hydrolase [Gemmatimonas groenlandica]|uniref:beta-lactamase n=1 Tax=Gemmatimonas groenlandica TaxID=2732249 RepID=A0A6M4IUS0_9BACT|nr:serine hydrolase [Gemmatimonas groenlandica]QJR37908.1 serine hydrolase [Gemmatimonas groenlandica]
MTAARARGHFLGSFVVAAFALLGAKVLPAQPVARRADSAATVEVQRMLDLLLATSSMYAVHPATGRTVEVRADLPMNTMSTIKIAIMLLAYRDAEAGRLNLEERITLREEDRRGGTGMLKRFSPGMTVTYRDLVDQMIITSDNTATEALIVKLGFDRINGMLRELGFRETRLVLTLSQFYRNVAVAIAPERASLSDAEIFRAPGLSGPVAAAKRFEAAVDSTRWLGRTTAREMTTLLEGIYTARYASKASSASMMGHLFGQFYTSRLPATLRYRSDVRIAHKTGDFPPTSGSDVGVIEYPGGPLFISVYTNANRGDFGQLELTIGRLAELLVNRW